MDEELDVQEVATRLFEALRDDDRVVSVPAAAPPEADDDSLEGLLGQLLNSPKVAADTSIDIGDGRYVAIEQRGAQAVAYPFEIPQADRDLREKAQAGIQSIKGIQLR